jgi:hypothetical protein
MLASSGAKPGQDEPDKKKQKKVTGKKNTDFTKLGLFHAKDGIKDGKVCPNTLKLPLCSKFCLQGKACDKPKQACKFAHVVTWKSIKEEDQNEILKINIFHFEPQRDASLVNAARIRGANARNEIEFKIHESQQTKMNSTIEGIGHVNNIEDVVKVCANLSEIASCASCAAMTYQMKIQPCAFWMKATIDHLEAHRFLQ